MTVEWAVASAPFAGETESGDAALVREECRSEPLPDWSRGSDDALVLVARWAGTS